jgi:phosphatidylglycerophosphate synthase
VQESIAAGETGNMGTSNMGFPHNAHNTDERRGTDYERRYHRWVLVTAAGVGLLVFGAEFPMLTGPASAALAAWSAAVMGTLFYRGARYHPQGTGPRLPNALTTTRVFAGIVLLLLIAGAEMTGMSGTFAGAGFRRLLVAGLLVIELTDFFDGILARRAETGPFGATWDLESDSIFALGLALTLRHLFDVSMFVLLIGLMRYFYALLWQNPVPLPRVPKAFTWYAKTTTASLVTTMIVVMAPIIGSGLRSAALAVVLGMQMLSFAWDITLQIRERRRGRVAGRHAAGTSGSADGDSESAPDVAAPPGAHAHKRAT